MTSSEEHSDPDRPSDDGGGAVPNAGQDVDDSTEAAPEYEQLGEQGNPFSPDDGDDLTTHPDLGPDSDPVQTGTGDPLATGSAGATEGSVDGGRPEGDPSALADGDRPRPSPDI